MSARRWLLFVHQVPTTPSNLRVRTWRRLQQLGAVPVKQAVYVLPDSPGAREDFEWLKTEIKDAGGDASVFAAENVDSWSDDALVEEFRTSRQEAYATLAGDVERVLRRKARTSRKASPAAASLRRIVEAFRQRLTAIEGIDFFGSAGHDRAAALVQQIEELVNATRRTVQTGATGSAKMEDYQNRVWVTRPRPGVDRMASAWLIQRFIDPRARFGFAADREAVRDRAVPFDMFGVEFSHHGDGCTFETLCGVFGIQDAAVARIAVIVHDLDLKDGRFGAPEVPTVGSVIEGLRLAHSDDNELLTHGITLFDALYRSFAQSERASGPAAAKRGKRKKSARSR